MAEYERDIDMFEAAWDGYVALIRGALVQASEAGSLTLEVAQAALDMKDEYWRSKATKGGRWLANLQEMNQPLGAKVRRVLLEEVSFHRLPEEAGKSKAELAAPCVGAAVGLVGGVLLHAPAVAVAGGTAVLAGVGVPVGKVIAERQKRGDQEDLPRRYTAQLDVYRDKVVTILEEG